MRIAICEDNKTDLTKLRGLLMDYLQKNGLFADIECFNRGEDLLADYKPEKFQIIFLDIYLAPGELTGMQVAEYIRAKDPAAAIILTTASSDFALAGYRVAVYYLLKPIAAQGLAEALDKCRLQIENYSRYIEVSTYGLPRRLLLHHIYYVEAQRKTSVFALSEIELVSPMTFAAALKLLPDTFYPCHRSYAVNLVHVRELTNRDFVLANGILVPVSRSRLAEAKERYLRYLGDKTRNRPI